MAAAAEGGQLDGQVTYEREAFSYPNGCHVAEVEVDPETGVVDLVSYTAVDDFGNLINPLVVSGQGHGGIAQGVGQALFEHVVFDPETGQPLSASFMDYTAPRADRLPDFDVQFHLDCPSPSNPLGVKGCGESGCTAAPPAIVSAVCDALAEFGVSHIEMPLTPLRVWQAIVAAKGG